MFYLVQENVFRHENYEVLFHALNRLGMEYEVIECPPFTNELEFTTDRKDVFCFGSVKMARLAIKNDFKPGSFYGGNHDFEIYSQQYKENLLNYDSLIIPLNAPIEWKLNEGKFIRPTKDSKIFTGGLFSKVKWEDKLVAVNKYLEQAYIPDFAGMIQVSEPKIIYKEARVWIVDKKVVTSSYYRFVGNIDFEEEVAPEGLEFAQSMAELYQVADAFVMDICFTPEGWKIVEINCVNCAGFYKGDLQKLIVALENKFN